MAASSEPGESVVKSGDLLEGRYRILDTLGSGGMGSVYLAEHSLIKRRVAIKILHPDLATDSNVVERFMNEARAAGTLGHPNIVESTDMGFTHNHVPYIVFEHLEGSLLTDEIYRCGGLSLRRSLWIAQQIASALHAAHNAGVIHRDLKSDNVFLTDRDEMLDHVKVLDFGISLFSTLTTVESDKLVMGTPEYLAPEAITRPESIDARADIYALGVILYEMLTARRPFPTRDDAPKALLHRIVHDAPEELNAPEVPAALADIIFGKLLAKDPNDRFPSMLEVEAALDQFVTEKPTPIRTRNRPPRTIDPMQPRPGTRTPVPGAALDSKPRRPPAPVKPSWIPYAIAAGGILIGVIGLVFGLTREPASTPALTPPCDCAPAPAR